MFDYHDIPTIEYVVGCVYLTDTITDVPVYCLLHERSRESLIHVSVISDQIRIGRCVCYKRHSMTGLNFTSNV